VCPEAPRTFTSTENLEKILDTIKFHNNPLIIIGKEAAYSCAEKELLALVEKLKIPFLNTPMAKGVVDDNHKYCVNAARST
jgi:2-hydroxyacyl-CoA lyase 1